MRLLRYHPFFLLYLIVKKLDIIQQSYEIFLKISLNKGLEPLIATSNQIPLYKY